MKLLLTPQKHSRRDICNYLAKTVFPQTIAEVFAVGAKCPDTSDIGWKLYDVEQEFGRLGVTEASENLNNSDTAGTLKLYCHLTIQKTLMRL